MMMMLQSDNADDKQLLKVINKLQTPSISFSDRLAALRYLYYHCVKQKRRSNISSTALKHVTELVRDNILYMIMNEEHTSDLTRRQMIRAELFLMLASFIESPQLFNEAHMQMTDNNSQQEEVTLSLHMPDTNMSDTEDTLLSPTSPATRAKTASSNLRIDLSNNRSISRHTLSASGKSPIRSPMRDKNASSGKEISYSNSDKGKMKMMSMTMTSMIENKENINNNTSIRRSKDKCNSSNATAAGLAEPAMPGLHNIISNNGKKSNIYKQFDHNAVIKSTMKNMSHRINTKHSFLPRPTVFFDDVYQRDDFASGVTPTDWINQDKRLGYQKGRMWFPKKMVGISNEMVPSNTRNSSSFTSDTIVKEYLQMRALTTYVGDLVMPYKQKGLTDTSHSSLKKRMVGAVNYNRFDQAMKEAVDWWSPLLGGRIPLESGRKQRNNITGISASHSNSSIDDAYNNIEGIQLQSCKAKYDGHSTEHAILITKGMLRSLLRKERKHRNSTKLALTEALDVIVNDVTNTTTNTTAHAYTGTFQSKLTDSYQQQQEVLKESISAISKLMLQSVELQYSTLPPRYLCVLEGRKAASRDMVEKLIHKFCQHRRRSYLVTAFGVWKIVLVQMESIARRKQYCRNASCYLVTSWFHNYKCRKIRLWLQRWQDGVARIIFIERNAKVIPLQCLYRQWRDYRIFINLHLIKTYNGPLSDMLLAPDRGTAVAFKVPRIIREQRRALWYAAVPVQAIWRGLRLSRIYWVTRRKVILIQSICRMYPKYLRHRYLVHVVIRTQSWTRRTVIRNGYMILKKTIIVVQRWVRRFICICRVRHIFERIWDDKTKPKAPAILIQRKWRRVRAILRVSRIREYRRKKLWSALLVQKRYYQVRDAYATYVLMSAYRAREIEDETLKRHEKAHKQQHHLTKLQILYRNRLYHRVIVPCVKIQAWIRGRYAFIYSQCRRRIRWASRKLRHFFRVRVYRARMLARRIQCCWWNYKRGSRLRHLILLHKASDLQYQLNRHKVTFRYASIIQAYVRGVYARSWVKKYVAATRIQRVYKSYHRRQQWLSARRKYIRKGISLYAARVLKQGVHTIAAKLVKKHIEALVRPQAVIRGYVVRTTFMRVRQYADMYAMAVLKVQRCWRKSGALHVAMDELMVIRRRDRNVFKGCSRIHHVVVKYEELSKASYHIDDPRHGLSIVALLYRLGRTEIKDMFTHKWKGAWLSDIKHMSISDLSQKYSTWRHDTVFRSLNKDKGSSSSSSSSSSDKDSKRLDTDVTMAPPTQFLKLLIAIANSPSRTDMIVQDILPIQEVYTPQQFHDYFTHVFQAKFGTNFQSRMHSICAVLLDKGWNVDSYSNYRCTGYHVITRYHVKESIHRSKESKSVGVLLGKYMSYDASVADIKWEYDRVKAASDLAQDAIDTIYSIICTSYVPLPTGRLMCEKVTSRLSSYKRKLDYQTRAHANNKSSSDSHASIQQQQVHVASAYHSVATVDDWVTADYNGPTDRNTVGLECSISSLKIMYAGIKAFAVASKGIDALKQRWHYSSIARAVRKHRASRFLSKELQLYRDAMKANRVYDVWCVDQRKHLTEKRLGRIMDAVLLKRKTIESSLAAGAARFNWVRCYDEERQMHQYIHRTTYEERVEMPSYTYVEYAAVCRIQAMYRLHLRVLEEHRNYKAAEARRKILMVGEALSMRNKFSIRPIKFNITVQGNKRIDMISSGIGSGSGSKSVLLDDMNELLSNKLYWEVQYPYRMRLGNTGNITAGRWMLHRHAKYEYEVVVTYNINKAMRTCDIKAAADGKVKSSISYDQLYDRNYVKGDMVEVREDMTIYFYLATIIDVVESPYAFDEYLYTVVFSNERETIQRNVDRTMLRPAAAAFRAWCIDRKSLECRTDKIKARKAHYVRMKAERVGNASSSISDCIVSFQQSWSKVGLKLTAPTATAAATVTDGKKVTHSYGKGNRGKGGNSGIAASTTIVADTIGADAASGKAGQLPSSTRLKAMHDVQQSISKHACCLDVSMSYVKLPMKYGWKAVPLNSSGTVLQYRYYDVDDDGEPIVSDEPVYYDAVAEYCAARIQAMCKKKQAQRHIKRLLHSQKLDVVVQQIITKYQTIASVGYREEGVTIYQRLVRLGRYELADIIKSNFVKVNRVPDSNALTLQYVATLPVDKYESALGIAEYKHVKELSDFQHWYKHTTADQRTLLMSFVNSFDGPRDERTIQACILDSEEVIVNRFLREYASGSARTRIACKALVEASRYPITNGQLEYYFKRYKDMPDAARDNIEELVNKQTTSLAKDEKLAYEYILIECSKLMSIVGNRKLKIMKEVMASVVSEATAMVALAQPRKKQSGKQSLPMGPSAEGKAAYLLRDEVLNYITSAITAAAILQRNVRMMIKKLPHRRLIVRRKSAVVSIQQAVRSRQAMRGSVLLRKQQNAVWEQLWDDRRHVMYYYNRDTLESKYHEPREHFRPLVRDRRSAKLLQAWPHLDIFRRMIDSMASAIRDEVKVPVDLTVCSYCKVRKCVRNCYDCVDGYSNATDDGRDAELVPYCFPCFHKVHSSSDEMERHSYFDTDTSFTGTHSNDSKSLHCCICKALATRKCEGIIDDSLIDSACEELLKTESPQQWLTVLERYNIAGGRKLAILMSNLQENVGAMSDGIYTAAQVQQLRSILDRSRAECDESYCYDCYLTVHAGGKRAKHKFIGFAPAATVCHVCCKAPADSTCETCDNSPYCNACMKVFHSKGKKKKHVQVKLIEAMNSTDLLCEMCERRPASSPCSSDKCDFLGCDSCYECTHIRSCKWIQLSEKESSAVLVCKEARMKDDVSEISSDMLICVGCSKPASVKCKECHDYYCIEVWMGNEGCFRKFHSKGNRIKHTKVNVREKMDSRIAMLQMVEAEKDKLRRKEAKMVNKMEDSATSSHTVNGNSTTSNRSPARPKLKTTATFKY